MKKSALQNCLTVSLMILAATVSAQAQNSLNTNTQRAVSCNDQGVTAIAAG
ncbi:MAG: hypothetical protein M3R69_05175 [Acidobacteriota bacterium]|nr:hypothetical protein [Acidobacteriota bacterium]